MWEDYTSRNDVSSVIVRYLYGQLLGLAEVNDNCVTRMCAGTVDRGCILLAK